MPRVRASVPNVSMRHQDRKGAITYNSISQPAKNCFGKVASCIGTSDDKIAINLSYFRQDFLRRIAIAREEAQLLGRHIVAYEPVDDVKPISFVV